MPDAHTTLRPAESPSVAARVAAALVLLAALTWGVANALPSLWDQDEAAYAGFARHMRLTGELAVPEFPWSATHRKPPLLFWTELASTELFGDNAFAVRLPCALAVLGVLLLVATQGRRVAGRAAPLGAMVLATSLLVPALAHVAVTDAWVLLCDTALALALFAHLERSSAASRAGFWIAFAAGLLAKGPVVPAFAAALVGWTLAFDPRRRRLWSLWPWALLPLACAPFALWTWLAWQRTDGEFVRWMWGWYVAGRVKGGSVFGQVGPPGYHLAVLAGGLLPWSPALLGAVRDRRALWADEQTRRLLGWLVAGWLLWELFPSKLPTYALAGHPAAALLCARALESPENTSSRGVKALAAILAAVCVGAAAVVGWLGAARFPAAAGFALLAFGVLAAGLALGFFGRKNRRIRVLATAGIVANALVWMGAIPSVEPARGLGVKLAEALGETHTPGLVLLSRNLRRPSVPYYLERSGWSFEVVDLAQALARTPRPAIVAHEDDLAAAGHPSLPPGSEAIDAFDADHLRFERFWVLRPEGGEPLGRVLLP